MLHLSGGEEVLLLVWYSVCAVFGYVLSENDRKRLGRTPWGIPSGIWALLWFLLSFLALILFVIAHVGAVRRARQLPPTGASAAYGPPPPMDQRSAMGVRPDRAGTPSASDLFPAYPRPANATPSSPGEPERAPTPPVSPAAWHPDPSGRFHYRWWDGYQWTSQVSLDGRHLVDTSPDQRIGPY